MVMKRSGRLLLALAALTGLVMATVPAAGAAADGRSHAADGRRPAGPSGRSCESLTSFPVRLPNATTVITSMRSVAANGAVPAYCEVKLTVNNRPSDDAVKIGVWLPADTWNGRFQGTGGGGFTGGNPDAVPVSVLQRGYAAAATDTGHSGPLANTFGTFAVNPDGTANTQLIDDFGYLGIHEMTVAAKQLVRAFYGTSSFYSYWNGCSTGGRQGLMEAQRYPRDYDGIAAAAPAINWTKLHPAQLWGPLVMRLSDTAVEPCKLATAAQAAITACDRADGLADGIIGDWAGCDYDARELIGTETDCGPITAAEAQVLNKMWDGPRTQTGKRLWYGLERGANLAALNSVEPFVITLGWFQYWLVKNPGPPLAWDWRTITSHAQYEDFFAQSVREYRHSMATDDPDLSDFRDAGGKVVMWHGTADQLIPFRGTVDYYDRVVRAMGGTAKTERFARFFVAPGVQHCGGGPGATPVNALDAVVQWVEHDKAPAELVGQMTDSSGTVTTRPVCRYPAVAMYAGNGGTGGFTCTAHRSARAAEYPAGPG
jgi:hypothetical protein